MGEKNYILKDKKSTFIDESVKIGENVIIYENNRIEGDSEIGDNVTIYPGNFIVSSKIGKGTKLYSSFVENAVIGECCMVGPYAHLRPKAKLENFVRLGNFCEVKNSTIGSHTKVSHLAYVGDAEIGSHCNIGCGVVFVNFNGKQKFQTKVEDNAFIGSNVNIIAPVTIGNGAYICAGTTVDKNVLSDSFVIGRSRQIEKLDRAKVYLKKSSKK